MKVDSSKVMVDFETTKQVEYWEAQLKKIKEEDFYIRKYLRYFEVEDFSNSNLQLLKSGLLIVIVSNNKILSWANHGVSNYCINIEDAEQLCDCVGIYSNGEDGDFTHSKEFWSFTKAKYYLMSLLLTCYKTSDNYSTELADSLKMAISLIDNAENILNK